MKKIFTITLGVLLLAGIQSCKDEQLEVVQYHNWLLGEIKLHTGLFDDYEKSMENAWDNVLLFQSDEENKYFAGIHTRHDFDIPYKSDVRAPKAFDKEFQQQADDLEAINLEFEKVYDMLQDFFKEQKWEHRDAEKQLQEIEALALPLIEKYETLSDTVYATLEDKAKAAEEIMTADSPIKDQMTRARKMVDLSTDMIEVFNDDNGLDIQINNFNNLLQEFETTYNTTIDKPLPAGYQKIGRHLKSIDLDAEKVLKQAHTFKDALENDSNGESIEKQYKELYTIYKILVKNYNGLVS